jgi:2-keto-4-pentenoate hydratase/2-oxohepta-3-ene-1,7-dioic acid hydratase in catechol pathway
VKLATFVPVAGGAPKIGVLAATGGALVDLAAAHAGRGGGHSPELASMQALIESGQAGLDLVKDLAAATTHLVPLDDVRLLAPLPVPVQVRDCMCFEGHLLGSIDASMRMSGANEPSARHQAMRDAFYQRPIYYKANRFAVTGTDTDVVWPAYSQVMDYELEMGCVLGRRGRDIPVSEARDYIFGFTIFNDFSARDTQGQEMLSSLGPSKSKDFDNANAMGPWIVTADEFDPYSARMIVRINGEVQSEGSSSTMTYSFEDLIAFISTSETLHPGEILGSGTVGGGCGLEQGRMLQDGDTVELEIEGIGILKNRVFSARKS